MIYFVIYLNKKCQNKAKDLCTRFYYHPSFLHHPKGFNKKKQNIVQIYDVDNIHGV